LRAAIVTVVIVGAINEGRGAACAIDKFLMGHSNLPAPVQYG
jgi:hypothetical protein